MSMQREAASRVAIEQRETGRLGAFSDGVFAIAVADHVFLYLNGLLLLFVTFVLFPAAIVAAYLQRADATVACFRANLRMPTMLSSR